MGRMEGRVKRKKIERMRRKGRIKCLNEEGLEEKERWKEGWEGRLERRKVGRLISMGKRGRRGKEGRKGGKGEGWKVDKHGKEGWKAGRLEGRVERRAEFNPCIEDYY